MTKISKWIKDLPAGTYLMSDLKRISKSGGGSSILQQMLRYGASVKQQQAKNNLWEYVFQWPGFQQQQQQK